MAPADSDRPTVAETLATLEAHGCSPCRLGPGLWIAQCPGCRDEGRFALACVHAPPDGTASATVDVWRQLDLSRRFDGAAAKPEGPRPQSRPAVEGTPTRGDDHADRR